MRGLMMAAVALAAPAAAQQAPAERVIQVVGQGKVATPPDVAVVDVWLRGEGATPDEASAALAARQTAVADGVAAFLGGRTGMTGGNVVVIEVRGPECRDANGYNAQPRLSQGPCAIIGYLATAQASFRTDAVAKAGTAAGLAARLGALDGRVQSFALADDAEARRRATAAAIADARAQAETIAAAAGARLGSAISIRDNSGGGGEIVVSGALARVPGVSAAAPPPPPVEIAVSPRPIETRAQLYVSYAILP